MVSQRIELKLCVIGRVVICFAPITFLGLGQRLRSNIRVAPRFLSSVSEEVPPTNGACTLARRFVTGLSGRKCASTSRTRATSSMPVCTIAMRRSSCALRRARPETCRASESLRSDRAARECGPVCPRNSRSNFISRSEKSYCGPSMKMVLMSAGIAGDFEQVQFLKLDVLVLDKCFEQSEIGAVGLPERWFLVTRARNRACSFFLRPDRSSRW